MSWLDLANSVCIYALSLGFEINDLTVLFSPIAVHLSELPYKLNDQNPVFIYKTFQFEDICMKFGWNYSPNQRYNFWRNFQVGTLEHISSCHTNCALKLFYGSLVQPNLSLLLFYFNHPIMFFIIWDWP